MPNTYRLCAQQILESTGGAENLVRAAHCATRLRLTLRDGALADAARLEAIPGVQGMYRDGSQLQIILGTGTVDKVYEEFIALAGPGFAGAEAAEAAAAPAPEKQGIGWRVLHAMGEAFLPLLPALVAEGILMGITAVVGELAPGVTGSSWYAFLHSMAYIAFSYLPMLVAVSAARLFGGNPPLAALVGFCIINPDLAEAWAGTGLQLQLPKLDALLALSPDTANYQQYLLPVLISVWLMCRIEQWVRARILDQVSLFFTPVIALVSTVTIAYCVITPVFSLLENLLLWTALQLLSLPQGLGALALGALYPLCVMCGVHHIYIVIEVGLLAQSGLNMWMPVVSAANFAQCGACLAAALRARTPEGRSHGRQAALSAALGITEPAMFGVNLRYRRPFFCAMAGGALGAMVATVSHVMAQGYGVSALLGFLIIEPHSMSFYALTLLVSGGFAFGMTWLTWQEASETGRKAPAMPKLIACEAGVALCPVPGQVIPLAQVGDPVIASGAMGQGVGILPSEGMVLAPLDGQITALVPTAHAIGLTASCGMKILIHVGINTAELGGQGFAPLVRQGDTVVQGQPLLLFDRSAIEKAGLSDTVAVLLTNSANYRNIQLFTGEAAIPAR